MWNCHGPSQAIPYTQLLAEKSDIIILTEHWLWPYELSKLDSVITGYTGLGVSDGRLNEECSLRRGCGGVGFLWKQQLPVIVVSIGSDRIFAVQLTLYSSSSLSIVGVYLPTTDSPIVVFKEYLQELENITNVLQADGPVIIMGDFNAHISTVTYP